MIVSEWHTHGDNRSVNMKQPVSDTVETNTENTQSLSGPQLLNDQSRSCSWFEPCWSFLCPPPLSCWPAFTLTTKHSSLVIRTWSVHEYLVFVWFAPEFVSLNLKLMKNLLCALSTTWDVTLTVRTRVKVPGATRRHDPTPSIHNQTHDLKFVT